MKITKILLILSILVLLLSMSYGVQEAIFLNETWGSTFININVSQNCTAHIDTPYNIKHLDEDWYNHSTYFDNNWYCGSASTTVFRNQLEINSSEDNYNTEYGIKIATANVSCSGNNCYRWLQTYYNETLILRDDSEISYYVNVSSEGANTVCRLIFETDDNTSFSLPVGNSGSFNNEVEDSLNACLLNTTFWSASALNTYEFKNFTFKNVTEGCNSAKEDFSINTGITKTKLVCQWGATSPTQRNFLYFDDLYIEFYNGSNELPLFNLSLDDTLTCANNSQQRLELNITIDDFDEEGDTILYATTTDEVLTGVSFESESIYTTTTRLQCAEVTFSDFLIYPVVAFTSFLSSCRQVPVQVNAQLPEYTQFLDSCLVIATQNSTEFYLDDQLIYGNDTANVLVYNPYCNRRKETFIDLQDSFRDFYYNTELYIEDTINNSLNITFYDSIHFGGILASVGFFVNESGNLNVYSINETNYTLLFGVDLSNNEVGGKKYIATAIRYDYSENDIEINVSDGHGTDYYSTGDGFLEDNSGNIIKYVGTAIDNRTNSVNYQENFLYGGLISTPVFSSVKPLNITVFGYGRKNFGLWVSDNQHTEDEFRFTNLEFTVSECALSSRDITTTDTGEALNPLKNALMGLCRSLDNSFTVTRSSDGETYNPSRYGFCFIMFVAYFILTALISAGLSIWIYFLKRSLVFPAFIFIWQVFNIFGYFLLDYSINVILLIAIAMALSLMLILRQLFLTGEVGSES